MQTVMRIEVQEVPAPQDEVLYQLSILLAPGGHFAIIWKLENQTAIKYPTSEDQR